MTTEYTYADAGEGGGARSLKWSALGLVGRQGIILLFSVALARILGPESYGIVAQANVYIALTTLLLDQGISAALTSAGELSRRTAGAAVTLNLIFAVLLAGITIVLAPAVGAFFSEPELSPVLSVLGVALLAKAIAVVPRMLLARRLDFKSTAKSDFSGALAGGLVGFVLALVTGSYWALVVQAVVMDLVTAAVLVIAARPPAPNMSLRLVILHFGFSVRVFGSNLVGYSATNAANILIGRFLGTQQVGLYNFAFGFLQLPVSIAGQVMNRVVFPLIARSRFRGEPIVSLVSRALRGVSLLTFPLMATLAVGAHDLVDILLGQAWLAAAPVMTLLAISGARQSLTTLNTPILLGLGKAALQLRFSLAAAALQITSVTVGLNWGIVGVAVGYTVAGFVLTPVISVIQKRESGLGYRDQWRAIAPSLHASLWMAAAYLLIAELVPFATLPRTLLAVFSGALVFVLVLRLVHPRAWNAALRDARSVLRRR